VAEDPTRGKAILVVINPTFSARVGADPVHWGNQRFETLEDTREDRALPTNGLWVPCKGKTLVKAPTFM